MKTKVNFFNVRGWLTSISSPLFSQELFYNDPSGLDGQMARYNGNISAMKWGDHLSGNPMGYVFGYDKLNRLTESNHFEGMTATNKYKEWMDYDLNGNILTLQRSGNSSALIDDLTFDYGTFGNRLMSVTDTEADTTTFHDRNTTGADYFYDPNGNMIQDLNKEVTSIQYDHNNLPRKVTFQNGDSIVYAYDAAVIKLQQKIYEGGQLKVKYDYAGEFFYKNDTLQFIRHEEGRVVIKNEQIDYQYFHVDHLGNVRLTFSTTPENYEMKEDFEGGENGFDQLHPHTNANANTTVGGNKVERLQAGQQGALVMVSVNKGDTLKISVQANYEVEPSGNNLLEIAFTVLFSNSMYGAGEGSGGALENEFSEALAGSGMAGKGDANDAPRAYLNYIYFTEDMQFHTSGFVQITTAAEGIGVHELVVLPDITADIEGYVLAYLTNEDQQPVDIHFDDFTVYHGKTNVVSADSYYPNGGVFGSFVRTASRPQIYKYNAKETEEKWGVQDFGRRRRDPFGGPGFMTIDRFAEKYYSLSPYSFAAGNPIFYNDINGDSLWINFGNNQRVLYNNGQLQNADGSRYEGAGVKVTKKGNIRITNSYLSAAVGALNTIGGTDVGSSILGTLQSSENNFTIANGAMNKFDPGDNGKSYIHGNNAGAVQVLDEGKLFVEGLPFNKIGSGGIIYWNPNSTEQVMTTRGLQTPNSALSLGHELFHAYDANFGLLDRRLYMGINGGHEERTEFRASYFENQLRQRLNYPYRTFYNHTDPGAPPLLQNGNPINVSPPSITWLQYLRF